MYLKKRTTLAAALTISIVVSMGAVTAAEARPKAKFDDLTNYTVVHAIPTGFGADIVDVYANNLLLIDNATPGALKSFAVPRGKVTIQVYANGVVPGPTTTPLLASDPVYLSNGNNVSFVAHLTADEKPKLSIFKNMLTEPGSKRSWITIRHLAAAPEVQVRLNGTPVFVSLANGMERKRSLNFATYNIDAVLSGTTTVVVGPISTTLVKSVNQVLYVWGAQSKGSIAVIKQEIPSRK